MTEPIEYPKDFGFTEEHDLLRTTARRLLADKVPMDVVRKLAESDEGYDEALWKEMCELGWAGLVLPERLGGAELDSLSLAIVLEECGRALLPSPLLGQLLAAVTIARAGDGAQPEELAPGIASGEIVATVALTEPGGSWEIDAAGATATRDGDDWVLSGEKTHVMWGHRAHLVLAPFVVDGAPALFAVRIGDGLDGLEIAPEVSVDATRRTARLRFAGARVPASVRLPGPDAGRDAVRDLHVTGFALLAAEMVGAAEGILGKTRDYAVERIQFGRPIGAFQAVKHPIVNVMIAIERARSLAYAAASALDVAPDRAEVPARMAKAAATDALRFAADRGVQLHGGFGFTWDCDAHLYFKRYLWSAATLGDAMHHRRHLARTLLDSE